MIFADLYYLIRVKGYSKLLLCEVPNCHIYRRVVRSKSSLNTLLEPWSHLGKKISLLIIGDQLQISFPFDFCSLISPSTSPFALSPNPPLQTMSCASSSVPSIPSKLSRPSSRDPLYSTASASSSVMNIPGL